MISRSDILQLTHSLTATERRYFRNTHPQKGQPTHAHLIFEALCSLQNLDDHELIQALPNPISPNQLAVTKAQLENQILRSLTQFHYGRTVTAQIREWLNQIEILYEKGLDNICLRIIRKGYDLAKKNDLFHSHIELIRWEMRLLKKAGAKQDFKRLNELAQEDQAMAETVLLDAQLRGLHDQMLEARTKQEPMPATEGVLGKINQRARPLPFTLQNIVHYIHIHQAHLLGTLHLLKPYYQAMIHHWQQNPHQIKSNQDLYLTAWIGYLESYQYSEDPGAFRQLLPYIRQQPWRKTQSYALVFFFTHYLELLHFLNHGQRTAGENLDTEIEEGLGKYDAHLSTNSKMSLIANLTTYYFVLGDLDRATHWNRRFLRSFSPQIRKELFEMALLTELMLLIEKDDRDLLEFKWEAAKKRFPTKQYPVHSHLLRFIGLWIKDSETKDHLPALVQAILDSQSQHLMLISHWASSRLKGITIYQAAFGSPFPNAY